MFQGRKKKKKWSSMRDPGYSVGKWKRDNCVNIRTSTRTGLLRKMPEIHIIIVFSRSATQSKSWKNVSIILPFSATPCVHHHRMAEPGKGGKKLQPSDHRVTDLIKHVLNTFDPHEFDDLLVEVIKKPEINKELRSVVNATGIWKNLSVLAAEHGIQRGVHTWKALQAVTSVLLRPGHRLSSKKLETITGIKSHLFEHKIEDICKEATQSDRSSTRNPHLFLV